MKPNDFLKKGLKMGDKVSLAVQTPSYFREQKRETVTVFFRGYRILAGGSVSDGPDTLVPVFVLPKKGDGTMGRLHYYPTFFSGVLWFEHIVSVRRI